MKVDPIQILLTRADSSPACAPAEDLAQRVRAAIARRARRRTVLTSASAVIVCAVLAAVLFHPRSIPPQTATGGSIDIARVRAELADLNSAAESHRRIAAAIQLDRARQVQHQIESGVDPQPDLLQRLASARSRAALLIVHEAERAASTASDSATIRESYQRAARLFPETPAGRLAAARLKSLGMVM